MTESPKPGDVLVSTEYETDNPRRVRVLDERSGERIRVANLEDGRRTWLSPTTLRRYWVPESLEVPDDQA